MTAYITDRSTKQSRERCNLLLLLLFLTGVLLGCLFVWHFDLSGRLFLEKAREPAALLDKQRFATVLIWNAKFLLVIYLLAFSRLGALLIPPVFGGEGFLLGAVAGCLISGYGAVGAISLCLFVLPRLVLVLPYGFLLGNWAVGRSLSFGSGSGENSARILLMTLLVMLLAAFLECTLARWLGGMYFLKFGV